MTGGCNQSEPEALPTATVAPPTLDPNIVRSATNTPAPTEVAVDLVQPIVSHQTIPVKTEDSPAFQMYVVRIDPRRAQFHVHYEPGIALSFTQWKNVLSNKAKVFINANFFTEEDTVVGLLIKDGMHYGETFDGYGGMFQVDENGMARVRSLVVESYDEDEMLALAIQAFPMLIESGGIAAPTGRGFDDPARRTVIAQDADGYVYIMTTGLFGQISFRDLQQWLLESGLNLDIAFALDGGRSTMMYVEGDPAIEITSFVPVPIVLAVY